MGHKGAYPAVRRRTEVLIGIMQGYDRFGSSREGLTEVTNWMLGITVASLGWSIVCFRPITDGGAEINHQLFILAMVFFWISAALFASFRTALYMIQALMERAMLSIAGIQKRMVGSRSREVQSVAESVFETLTHSVSLWCRAHGLIVRSIFVIVPAFVFYILGLSTIVCYVIHIVALNVA